MDRLSRSVKEIPNQEARFVVLWDILRPDTRDMDPMLTSETLTGTVCKTKDGSEFAVVRTNHIGCAQGKTKPRARVIEVMIGDHEPVKLNDLTAARRVEPAVAERLVALEAVILPTDIQLI